MNQRYETLDTNNKIIRNLWNISHTMRNISEGKGSQKRILILLKDNDHITQRELTQLLGIQPGSASEVIRKLEAAGLLIRTPSQTDRRTTELSLTGAGYAAAAEAAAMREKRHEKMFACLSDSEKERLLVLLEKLNNSWEEQYGKPDRENRK